MFGASKLQIVFTAITFSLTNKSEMNFQGVCAARDL